MNEEGPFPPALPAVVPSPIGPAISYSTIRAVTSRAESLLDRMDNKVRKRLQSGANDSAMVGAVAETKVRQRLAEQLAPAEQLFQDTHTLLSNQIIGNLAPAVATLEDLTGESATPAVGETTPAQLASQGAVGAVAIPPPIIPHVGGASLRAMSATPTVQGRPGGNTGPAPVAPPAGACANIDPAIWNAVADLVGKDLALIFGPLVGPSDNLQFLITDNCNLYIQQLRPLVPNPPCGNTFMQATEDQTKNQIIADVIVKRFGERGITLKYVSPMDACKATGVDCKLHPLDPACPKDCINHPEDPRCPVTPPTCPPPCIEVTCPPPVINVPPCPPFNLPSCIQIDLCDWKKFCDALTNCIGAAKTDCMLDNEEAYVLDDCNGLLGQAQKGFFGSSGDQITAASTVEQAVQPSTLQQSQVVQVFRVGRDLLSDLVSA